jgi:predicted RNase H-like HicB family nuclease
MMRYYAAFFVPSHLEEWHVLFPDLPECEAYGFTLQDAGYAAASALARCAEEKGALLPQPRSIAQIAEDRDWLAQSGVQFEKTITTIIPIANLDVSVKSDGGFLVSWRMRNVH